MNLVVDWWGNVTPPYRGGGWGAGYSGGIAPQTDPDWNVRDLFDVG